MSKPSQYPRSSPHQPPPEGDPLLLAAQDALAREARLRRWMLRVALATILIVGLTVAVGVVFIQRTLQRTAGVHTPEMETKSELASPSPSPREKMAAARPEQKQLLPRDPPVVRDPQTPPRERSLETVGGLSAAHLYQSYLNIGLLADAAENDVYSDADAKKLLATILAWMDNIDGQLTRLTESGLDPDNQKSVARVRQVAALLRTQARELRAYWDTADSDTAGKKDHETKFHKAREEAWTGIKDLLGIKDE
jgi:hypothetical protein